MCGSETPPRVCGAFGGWKVSGLVTIEDVYETLHLELHDEHYDTIGGYVMGLLERIPAGRVASMADIAGAVMYLASPAAGMVNGTVLLVDGGWTAQ